MIWIGIDTVILIAVIAFLVGTELGYAAGRKERKKK